MIKLSWQMTILYAIAMCIMGAVIIIGFYNEAAEPYAKYAFAVINLMIGYGGGKLQTTWEINKTNGGKINGGSTQPTERE
jgi:fucose permease